MKGGVLLVGMLLLLLVGCAKPDRSMIASWCVLFGLQFMTTCAVARLLFRRSRNVEFDFLVGMCAQLGAFIVATVMP